MRNQKPITLTESRLRQIIKEELSAARPQTHGLRHNQKLDVNGHLLVVNTKDPQWVQVNTAEGKPVARQAKFSGGRVYQQYTPDYEGSETYPLQYYVNGTYEDWDSEAPRGAIRDALPMFISRVMVAEHKLDKGTHRPRRARSLREGLDQQLNHAPGAAKPIRLTPKELERADRTIEGSPFTVVVRPQQDGRYWVVAVNVDTGLPLIPGGNLGQQYVDGKEGIPDAVRVVGRDLHKFTGYATPMTDKMRMGH